ncbi:hypothetical protein BC628DRAFT_1314422 [Trametes gibbosa]|nr:hypothetical protein BC628DRAFT_1314422 [Trametes gibbosa]UVI59132.1 Zn(2)-Cys(6)32 [Trametes gibbosa]
MAVPPFGPRAPGLFVDDVGPSNSELFSAAAHSILIPNEPGLSTRENIERSQAEPSLPSSTASSPPSVSTSNLTRKRVRPKIALAPGQPPTARGNDRIRVYVACHECRTRKIRCDGAKPICVQCQKRPPASGVCSYDAAPNRKGFDRRGKGASRRTPGATSTKRQRTEAEDASLSDNADRSRESTDTEAPASTPPSNIASGSEYSVIHSTTEVQERHAEEAQLDPDNDPYEYDPFAFDADNMALFMVPRLSSTSPPAASTTTEDQNAESIPTRPSMQFARDTWWDALLAFYALERDITTDAYTVALTSEQRNRSTRFIISDLRAMFQSCASWASFIHLPRFFAIIMDPVRRAEMQPSLLMSILALGVFTQSSEVERGTRGRERALRLLEMAHGALQSSLATGWVDVGLAQAAWMILYFEINSHPLQSWERSYSAMLLLDSLVRLFSLTTLDAGAHRIGSAGSLALDTVRQGFAGQPDIAMYATTQNTAGLAPNFVPLQQDAFMPQYNMQPFGPEVNSHAPVPSAHNPFYASILQQSRPVLQSVAPSPLAAGSLDSSRITPPHQDPHAERHCDCARLSLVRHWSSVSEFAPAWSTTMMWPTNLSEAEFRKEECRRLVWSSVMMIANMNAYASITPEGITVTGKLFVKEFESFALQTPSETLALSGTPVQADDVWSLNLRSMLLLHSCLRVRASAAMSGAQRSEFAVRAWLEIDDIERRLERHTCGMSNNYGFHSKEMLFSLRLCVSYEFQRFIPQITTSGNALFYRDKAEAWLHHLAEAVGYVWAGLRTSTTGGKTLDHRKALMIFWFMSGIKKCVVLWQADPSLDLALAIACKAAGHLEHLLLFWPAPRLRQTWQNIRYELVEACLKSGVPPPSASIPRTIPRNPSSSVA